MAKRMRATRPPVAINPSIPLTTQRELRKVAGFTFNAQQNANSALAQLPGKLGRNQKDLLQISQYVAKQVQSNGKTPINLTGLQLGPTGITAGAYTIGGVVIQVNKSGQIVSIT